MTKITNSWKLLSKLYSIGEPFGKHNFYVYNHCVHDKFMYVLKNHCYFTKLVNFCKILLYKKYGFL